ncbi:MAG: hypothetical protein ACI94L_000862 [Flavobacteriaceae bacterium]|jgi:hypothetical protein
MKNSKKIIIGCLILLGSQIAYSDGDLDDLSSEMTAAEFNQMGLSKLSDSELARLYQWVKIRESRQPIQDRLTLVKAEQPSSQQRIDQPSNKQTITTSIEGAFEGWTGATLFRLSNGQVWRQRLKGRWRYKTDSPSVEIKKNFMGYYVMRIDDKKSIGVTRIK